MAGCMPCLRWFVFGINLLFWIAGIATLVVGLLLLLDPAVKEHMELNTNLNDYYVGVYILIAVGAVMTILGFLGCFGALRKNQCFLVAFFILLVVIFCAQLACGILAYMHQDLIKQYVEKSMYDAVYDRYGRHAKITEAVDKIQNHLQCCGVHGFIDWLNSFYSSEAAIGSPELGMGADSHGRVPRSCCNEGGLVAFPTNCGEGFHTAPLWTFKQFLHEQGCSQALYHKFYTNLDIVIAVAIGVGAFQLLGMILTMAVCCWISRQKEADYRDY